MNLSSSAYSQTQRLQTQLRNLKCRNHPKESISKICKHTMCSGQPPLCTLCLAHHDIMHFSFLDDIESLINPQKIIQIKEIASEMKRRLDRDAKESEIKANPSAMLTQFQKCVEENKAKLIDCFLKNVISRKNDEIKAELQAIKNKLDRKYQLIVETNGQDAKMVQDFLITYVRANSRFKELGDSIRNQTGTVSMDLIVKEYLQGVEGIFQSVKESMKIKFESGTNAGKNLESVKKSAVSSVSSNGQKKESKSRIEEYYSDDDEDCKIIGIAPKKSTNRWARKENLREEVKEPPVEKKIKYNEAQKPVVANLVEETKSSSRLAEMDVEYKTSDHDKSTIGENSHFAARFGDPDEISPEISEDEDGKNFSEKLRKDYTACLYPKPIKDLVMSIFSMRANRKHILKEINTKLLSIRRIAKKDLKKCSEIVTEIYEILTGPTQSTPEATLQVAKLSKDFYHVIPYNLERPLDTLESLRRLLPTLESLYALRVTVNLLTGPKEDSNYIADRYKKLGCKIELLSPKAKEYKIIEKYFKETTPENKGHFKEFKLHNIFKIDRATQECNFNEEIKNRKLLWCGYRFTDTVKILKNGFKFMANVPAGLYEPEPHLSFVDIVTNCLPNCHLSLDNNVGFLFLCEVALGDVKIFNTQQIYDQSREPSVEIEKGLAVPVKKTGPDGKRKCYRYPITEFDRIRIKYLLKFQVEYR